MKKYSVARNENGLATAIMKNGVDVLRLERWTILNEKNVEEIVAVLNSVLDDPDTADALNAQLNKMALEMADLDNDPEARRELEKKYFKTYAKLAQLRQEK